MFNLFEIITENIVLLKFVINHECSVVATAVVVVVVIVVVRVIRLGLPNDIMIMHMYTIHQVYSTLAFQDFTACRPGTKKWTVHGAKSFLNRQY